MWQYIKENKLQDPKNKQFIKCDEKLSKVNQYFMFFLSVKKFFGLCYLKAYLDDCYVPESQHF